jgi:hypothetical protein
MDNFRLGEASSDWVPDNNELTRVGKDHLVQSTIEKLEARILKLEERLNLVLTLKAQGLDLSKFCFDIKPL